MSSSLGESVASSQFFGRGMDRYPVQQAIPDDDPGYALAAKVVGRVKHKLAVSNPEVIS